jgi:hypothetical protein
MSKLAQRIWSGDRSQLNFLLFSCSHSKGLKMALVFVYHDESPLGSHIERVPSIAFVTLETRSVCTSCANYQLLFRPYLRWNLIAFIEVC